MGLGRFGIGGCCQCSPGDNNSERAGPCGWCGLFDPDEDVLEMPVPPEKQCSEFVFDTFEYSKDYPRVPYWTFQTKDWTLEDWQTSWLFGDYHHLHQGHYLFSPRNRYVVPGTTPFRNYPDKLIDVGCASNNFSDGGANGELLSYPGNMVLKNIPPQYGNLGGPGNMYGYPFARRYENGVIVQGQTNKEDVTPLRMSSRLEFNAPRDQFPRYLHRSGSMPVYCYDEDTCLDTVTVRAGVQQSYLVGGVSCAQSGGTLFGSSPTFRWNYPGGEVGGLGYGLWIARFGLFSSQVIPPEAQLQGLTPITSYVPNEQILEVWYSIGSTFDSSDSEGDGYLYTPIPYRENFTLKVEIQFDKWHPDNRKCVLTVRFYIDSDIVFQKQHIIAKPGWRQDGSPTDEQSFIQSFCTGSIHAANHIAGANEYWGHVGPTTWHWEALALWDASQTPRESYWMDNWWNEYERL